MSRNRKTALALAALLLPLGTVAVFAVGGAMADDQPPAGSSDSTSDLLGADLAQALGLQEVVDFKEDGGVSVPWCKTGVAETPPDGVAYCMDNAVDPAAPDAEAQIYALGRRLNGHEVTDADIEWFESSMGVTGSQPG